MREATLQVDAVTDTLLQHGITAQAGERTNRRLFTLTVVTVPARPINRIAGLRGMTVGGIALAENEHGVLIITLTVLTPNVVASGLARRRHDRSTRLRQRRVPGRPGGRPGASPLRATHSR